jgi:hypothetical protein
VVRGGGDIVIPDYVIEAWDRAMAARRDYQRETLALRGALHEWERAQQANQPPDLPTSTNSPSISTPDVAE